MGNRQYTKIRLGLNLSTLRSKHAAGVDNFVKGFFYSTTADELLLPCYSNNGHFLLDFLSGVP
jgi:hypothetical protein